MRISQSGMPYFTGFYASPGKTAEVVARQLDTVQLTGLSECEIPWKGHTSQKNADYRSQFPRENGVIVYGGSGNIPKELYRDAEKLGRLLGQNQFHIVSGGTKGVPEAVSKGVMSVGGHAVAVGLLGELNELESDIYPEAYVADNLWDRVHGRGVKSPGAIAEGMGTGEVYGFNQRGQYTILMEGRFGASYELINQLMDLTYKPEQHGMNGQIFIYSPGDYYERLRAACKLLGASDNLLKKLVPCRTIEALVQAIADAHAK